MFTIIRNEISCDSRPLVRNFEIFSSYESYWVTLATSLTPFESQVVEISVK